MKFAQLFLIFAVAANAVDATSTRRLRRGADSNVNAKYMDLISEVDESTKTRVARRQLQADTHAARSERQMKEIELLSMSTMSIEMSVRLDVLSMSMLSMSM